MAQYCRYCTYLVVGDSNYCTERDTCMSDKTAKSSNKCCYFELNPIDAFAENEKGYTPRKHKKKVCDGQERL